MEYITHEKRYSPHTITSYHTDLEQFYSYLKEQYNIDSGDQATHTIIRSWIVSLLESGISPRTVNRKITTLKSYFRFLMKEGLIRENPMSRILAPRTSTRLPMFVEEESMKLLFEQVDFGTGFEAARDRLIIELFYHTGMRLSELVNLVEEDIDLERNQLKVTGKRNKQRIIPFMGSMGNHIGEYRKEKQRHFEGRSLPGQLFVTNKGKKLYPKFVYRVVNNYLSRVTTITKKSPHVIRHSFATHMLNHGADLNAIKDILAFKISFQAGVNR